MKGHGSKLSRKMDAAIIGLMTQRNHEEAAKFAGISVSTLGRWQELPEFDAAYRKARRKAFGQQVARLQHAGSAAVTTIAKLAVDPGMPPAVRARASYYVITLATKAIELDDFGRRLADVERALKVSKESENT
jgi:hypothetical protein